MLAKFLKFIIALALMPLLAAEICTLIDLAEAVPAGRWHEAWSISFGVGFVVWLLIFCLLPRTLWLYVLGHEFTHALAAMLAGGKVSAFKVSSGGGHVITDRVNWWIALSPYFVPIYALIWIGLWLTIDFYYPLKAWQPVLFFGIGFFWAFHVTFTVSMIHPRQTDLSREGYIFSGVIIALINVALILLLLSFLTHDLKWSGERFWMQTQRCYAWTGREIGHGFEWVEKTWRERNR